MLVKGGPEGAHPHTRNDDTKSVYRNSHQQKYHGDIDPTGMWKVDENKWN